jgi:hypothetical protein
LPRSTAFQVSSVGNPYTICAIPPLQRGQRDFLVTERLPKARAGHSPGKTDRFV